MKNYKNQNNGLRVKNDNDKIYFIIIIYIDIFL